VFYVVTLPRIVPGEVNDGPMYVLASMVAIVGLILCPWRPARWFGLALLASAGWSVASLIIGGMMHSILSRT
jgi:hypothetical protein